MSANGKHEFLTGVVEGFYGQPWSPGQRMTLLGRMRDWGLNTYFYAPKDDLKHRALWRACYDDAELAAMRELIGACGENGIRFVYGIGPGLDLRFSSPDELVRLEQRFAQLMDSGCAGFSLLFDDIPDRLHPDDESRFGSFAAAQAAVTNTMFQWVRRRRPEAAFLFCPTPYCGRMERRRLGGDDYLETIGRELHPEVNVFWTGPEIVPERITVESIRALRAKIRRPPVLWENLHANDYDLRRFYCGPYSGRDPELKSEIRGILANPNTEFEANFIPLRTLSRYLAATVSSRESWNPRREFLAAAEEWLPAFAGVGEAITLEDVILLADCYYLPFEDGEQGSDLRRLVLSMLAAPPDQWEDRWERFQEFARRIQALFVKLTEMRNRDLFYTFNRRVWELKEEMQLLENWFERRRNEPESDRFGSDEHLPGTYRGGLVAGLQRLLAADGTGRFAPDPIALERIAGPRETS